MSQIPNSNVTFTEINSALNFPFAGNNNITLGPNNIIRRLTGNTSLLNDTTPISTADLVGKVVFANLSANTASANVSSFGNRTNPIFAEAIVSFNTDMRDVVANWSAVALTDVFGNITPGDITVTPLSATSARLRLRNDSNVPLVKQGNIQATVSLVAPNALIGGGTVTDFTVRQESITVPMRAQMLDSGLVVSGETNPTAVSFETAIAATTLIATSTTLSNPIFTFNVTRVSGSLATVTVSNNAVSFELTQNSIGTNIAVYDVDVTMFNGSTRIINQIQRVTLTATRQLAALQLEANNAQARVYSNNSTFSVFSQLTASFPDLAGTSVVWSVQNTSGGNSATFAVIGSNNTVSTANLSFSFNTGQFLLRRENYTVRAEQRYGNGSVVTSNSVNVTLEGGNIGHTYFPPASVAASGYQAQTAVTSGSATVLAPQASLSWRTALASGTAASISQTSSAITLQLPAATRGVSVANEYSITSVVSFGGQEVATRSSSLIMSAAFNNYTFEVTAPASNTVVVDSDSATATIVSSASFNIPGGSIQWGTTQTGGFTSTTANSATSSLTVGNAQSSSESYSVTANLLDDLGRFVESRTLNQQLRAGSIAMVFNGPSSISNTGIGVRTFNASYSASVGTGSSVSISATRTSGDTFTVAGSNPLTISGATSFSTPSRSGSYRITAQPSVFGVNGTPQTVDATYSIVQTGSGATIAVANGSNSSYAATVTANGTATVTLPPGFVVSWSGNVTGGTATPSGNVLTVTATRTSFGSAVATATYTATILTDQGVATGESFNVTVTATATRLNPNLQLSVTGSPTNEGFTPIDSFVDVVASFDAGTVSFSTTRLSGSQPNIGSITNGTKIELSADRSIASTSVRVTATLRFDGQVIATAQRDVSLYAGSYFLDILDQGSNSPVVVFQPNTASAQANFGASTNYPYTFSYAWSSTGSATRSSVGPSTVLTLARSAIGTSTASGTVTVSIPAAGVSASTGYSLSATVQASVSVSLSPASSTINVNSDTSNPSATSSFSPNISGGTPPYSVSWSGSGSGLTFGSGTASSAVARFTRATRSGSITANVTDAGGRTASASASVSHVYDYTTVPISIGTDGGSFNADTTNAGASLTTTLSPSVTGGNGTLSFNWTVLSNPGGLGFSGGTVSSSAPRYSNNSRSISVRLTVTDQAGQSASRDFSVTHSYSSTAPAFSVSLNTASAFRNSFGPGSQTATASLRAVVNSGVPPYSYSWSFGPISSDGFGGTSSTSASGDTGSLTASTAREANFSVDASVTVSDSLGRSQTLDGSMGVSLWNSNFDRV